MIRAMLLATLLATALGACTPDTPESFTLRMNGRLTTAVGAGSAH